MQELASKGLNSDSLEKAKKLVQEGTNKLKETVGSGEGAVSGGWDSLQTYIKSVPGGDEVRPTFSLFIIQSHRK